ncbi:uncharacterized protein BX663DRAFT_553085 [Cokeromyces recurvatus]|uniref:uncharacterized protein n=1 Tax=Cokeromyces recurvatus TaxID=90255 RepID=UPI00221F53A3|nr:uncharacterized protein BX663DRAFT_553085 [Cokeromyces recurvatus]KAI7901747.1 hypothetical protein BX663DRAFT_553085 [Cokeromyces recurvatus]
MVKITSFWALGLTLVAGLVSAQTSNVATDVEVTAQFPDNPFGLIVNGQRNKVILDVVNKEKTPYTVFAVSGHITKADDYSKIIRNLTATRYGKVIEAGSTLQIPYNFYSEYVPGEHGLTVFVDLLNEQTVSRIVGFNGTITVTDPEGSWFDIQLIVLYGVLLAGAAGVAYIIREAFFADSKKSKKRTKKVEETIERPTHRDEKGEMVLDQSWIPEHNLNLNSPKKSSPKMKKRTTTSRK